MNRGNTNVISFRLDEEEFELVNRFAEQAGIFNMQDAPNRSAAVKILVSAALESGGEHQAAAVMAYRAARASMLSDVKLLLNSLLVDLSQSLR